MGLLGHILEINYIAIFKKYEMSLFVTKCYRGMHQISNIIGACRKYHISKACSKYQILKKHAGNINYQRGKWEISNIKRARRIYQILKGHAENIKWVRRKYQITKRADRKYQISKGHVKTKVI